MRVAALAFFVIAGILHGAVVVDERPVRLAAQLGDRDIVAVDRKSANQLVRWSDSGWVPVGDPVPGIIKAVVPAQRDAARGGGWVIVENRERELALWRFHADSTFERIGDLPGRFFKDDSVQRVYLVEDAVGDLWLSGSAGEVFCFSADQWVEVFRAEQDDLVPHDVNAKFPYGRWSPIRVIPMADDSVILCSDGLRGSSNSLALQGVVIVKNKHTTRISNIPGLPEGRILTAQLGSDGELLIGVFNQGLFRWSPGSEAIAISLPDSVAAEVIAAAFALGDGSYFVESGTLWRPEVEARERHGRLWFVSKSGTVSDVYAGMHLGYSPSGARDSAVLNFGDTWFFGTRGQGVMVVDSANPESVRWLDWRHGLPLGLVDRMFWLKSGALLVVQDDGASAALTNFVDASMEPNPFVVWPTRTSHVLAPDGRFFAALRKGPEVVLGEWNGKGWTEIPFDFPWCRLSGGELAMDNKSRLWVLPRTGDHLAPVFDLTTGKWLPEQTYGERLQSLMNIESFTFLPCDDPERSTSRAVFGAGKSVAFLDSNGMCHSFDGTSWEVLDSHAVSGKSTRPRAKRLIVDPESGRPALVYFGVVAVIHRNDQITLHDTKDFMLPQLPESSIGTQMPRQNLPELRTLGESSEIAIVVERSDFWWVGDDGLMRMRDGIVASWAKVSGPWPVQWYPSLLGLFFDSKGNVNLHAGGAFDGWIQIHPPAMETPGPGSIRRVGDTGLELAKPAGAHAWRWREKSNPTWSAWTTSEAVTEEYFPAGKLEFEIECRDTLLRDQSPSTAGIDLEYNLDELLKNRVSDLSSPDWQSRASAVKFLARHPSKSRQILEALPPSISPSDEWWITAAKQAVSDGDSAHREE